MKPWAYRLPRQFLPPQQAIKNWRYHLALCGNCREETRPILDLRCESTRATPDTLLSVTRSAINRLATTLAPTAAMLQGRAKRAQPTFAIIRKTVSPIANPDTRWVGDAAAAMHACCCRNLLLGSLSVQIRPPVPLGSLSVQIRLSVVPFVPCCCGCCRNLLFLASLSVQIRLLVIPFVYADVTGI